MRTVSLKVHLKQLYEVLNVNPMEVVERGQRYHVFENWADIHQALVQLTKFEFVAEEVQQIFELGIHFRMQSEQLVMDVAQYEVSRLKFEMVEAVVFKAIALLEEFFPDDDKDQLNVKLPDDITLGDFSNILEELDFIFNKCQIISSLNDKEEIAIRKVDSGSMWVILGFSVAAISIIGKFCKLAFGIREKMLEHQALKQQIRVYEVGANVIEVLGEQFTKEIKDISRSDAEKFIKENKLGTENDKEEINSAAIGLDKLAKLFYRGVEIYAPLSAPKEVAEAFPMQEEVLKLAKEILNLPAHTDNE